jgi:hypothetical protein
MTGRQAIAFVKANGIVPLVPKLYLGTHSISAVGLPLPSSIIGARGDTLVEA